MSRKPLSIGEGKVAALVLVSSWSKVKRTWESCSTVELTSPPKSLSAAAVGRGMVLNRAGALLWCVPLRVGVERAEMQHHIILLSIVTGHEGRRKL